MSVGDTFEVGQDGLRIPENTGFCFNAIASALSLLNGRFGDDRDTWLASRPLIACPDPPEALHMRLEIVDTAADTAKSDSANFDNASFDNAESPSP